MTAYLLTEAQHAQIVDALELPSLKTVSMLRQRDEALAMFKAMKPQASCAYGWRGNDGAVRDCIAPDTHAIIEGHYSLPLYTLGDTA